MAKYFAKSLLVVAMMSFGGCAEPDSGAVVPRHPVHGKVVLDDGKPLASGRVIFVSTKQPIVVEGVIGSDGAFSLSGGDRGEGAPEGEYRVRIEPESSSLPTKGRSTAKSTLPFPAKYNDEDTSGLTATVKPGENNLEPFSLLKK